jgi:N-methylhydantoinase B
LINAIQRGLAELQEGVGVAEMGLAIPAQCAVISGFDPRAGGKAFINQLVLPSLTGGAGAPAADGWLTTGLPAAGGHMLRDSVEIAEYRYPIRIAQQTIVVDSEGAGRFRGSPGGLAEYGPVDCTIELMYTSDGNVNPAQGVRGGLPGGRARQFKRDAQGAVTDLAAAERVTLAPGDSIITYSCGGGGYGLPTAREPERVRHDVVQGWISRSRARDIYGVVLDDDDQVDTQETADLRRQLQPAYCPSEGTQSTT